jgi:hypothetical protein
MTNFDNESPSETDESPETPRSYRGSSADPAFGFILAVALSVGLIPLLPDNADLRYTLTWGALAVVGVLAWLLGNMERIGQEKPDNLLWGPAFGIMLSVPFMVFFTDQFGATAHYIFPNFGIGTVLAYLVFIMPLAETLFFRGTMQRNLDFWIVGILGGLWTVILFFPVMWSAIIEAPYVGIFLAVAFFAPNMMYSYVRERNGLAAAWLCQITANLILIFIPFITEAP